jgi:ketosteroid isomerase-like protein
VDEHRILWELEQRRLITETLLDYCEYVDRNDPASLVARVFTEDARFELGSRHAVAGHEQLRRMFAKTLAGFTRTSHHLSNVRIGFDGDDHADATAYVYAWHQTEAARRVEVWGRYRDRLRLTEGGWRIESRCIAMHGFDGWEAAPFETIERLPNPAEVPSPAVQRR